MQWKSRQAYMYTNTFKNELTTDQKGKLLLNMCGMQWRKEYSYKTYANCTGFIVMVFILFDFILNIPVNKFSVTSAHLTKIKRRGSREGMAEGPDPLPGKSETFGALWQYWSRSPGKSKVTKPAFNIG